MRGHVFSMDNVTILGREARWFQERMTEAWRLQNFPLIKTEKTEDNTNCRCRKVTYSTATYLEDTHIRYTPVQYY